MLSSIEQLSINSKARKKVVDEVRALFQRWAKGARGKLDTVAEEFPEFYEASQQRLAERMLLHSERDYIVAQRRSGAIPNSVAAQLLDELDESIRALRGYDTTELKIDPTELLRKVPCFADLPEQEIPRMLPRMRQRTVPARQDLIQQGSKDDSLYLIARGKMRVLRGAVGHEVEVALLGPGDFVGRGGFLGGGPHAATSRALTPCAVYELKRRDLVELSASCPRAIDALEALVKGRSAPTPE